MGLTGFQGVQPVGGKKQGLLDPLLDEEPLCSDELLDDELAAGDEPLEDELSTADELLDDGSALEELSLELEIDDELSLELDGELSLELDGELSLELDELSLELDDELSLELDEEPSLELDERSLELDDDGSRELDEELSGADDDELPGGGAALLEEELSAIHVTVTGATSVSRHVKSCGHCVSVPANASAKTPPSRITHRSGSPASRSKTKPPCSHRSPAPRT